MTAGAIEGPLTSAVIICAKRTIKLDFSNPQSQFFKSTISCLFVFFYLTFVGQQKVTVLNVGVIFVTAQHLYPTYSFAFLAFVGQQIVLYLELF
jgi:hypothetical protein